MSTVLLDAAPVRPAAGLPSWLTLLLATACGLIAANIYYAQPLVGPISASLGLSHGAAGLIVTVTQIGYVAGLLFLVPLGDLVESRRLVMVVVGLCATALAGAAVSTGALPFLIASLLIGLCSVAVQILVPFAAHMAPDATRGRVVGNVMSGLMLGIMLSRPAASFVADLLGWHAVFWISAVLMVGMAALLGSVLPRRQPSAALRYGRLLASMAGLMRGAPVLRRRALYQAALFGAFSVFWTTVPLFLAETYHLSQSGIALFALAGVAGAVAAPIAGRWADKGWSRGATGLAIVLTAASFLLGRFGLGGTTAGLGLLVLSAILLDFGSTANLVLGQRAIFMLSAEARNRLNGLYMATFFLGGAAGSALGGWTYAEGGWSLASWVGFALPLLALGYYLTEPRP
ncbi:MFS transporter [Pararoseomonas indoligenes]|uniref:MFS transporter n=1 Tax=Roseomonas indoligenes TaxID=2820811 RepID=A0A940N2L0_9PROT|nr:MFS transporter [Pararoseomonas indoligenes]